MRVSIPIIDLADHEEQILPTLEKALCDIGFVLVKGHGVPRGLVSDLRQQLVDYFDRPLADKMAERIRRITTGAISRWAFSHLIPKGYSPTNTRVTSSTPRSRRMTHCAPPAIFAALIGGQTSPPVCEKPSRLFGRPARLRVNGCSL